MAGKLVGDREEDPSLVEHGSVRNGCSQGKQCLRKVGEWVSGRGGGRAPASCKDLQYLYVSPKPWARMAFTVRGRKARK